MRDSPDQQDTGQHDIAVLRVLDAAANRAGEALRVVEDYLRFVLDDRHLTALCKELRHDLAAALSSLPQAERHAARETASDVGTALTTPAEMSRPDMTAVVAAGFQRAQQALRSLEEYGKVVDPTFGARFEQLRYRTYTLQRAIDLTRTSLDRLASARLCVLLDGRPSLDEFASMASALVTAGVDMIQLRDKRLADRELAERARQLRQCTHGTKTLFIMNDRPDIARLAGADGVHVGQEDVTVKDARNIVGAKALVGVSTHSIQQARAAVMDGANYIGVGPTFPSPTKRFESFAGVDLLRAVAAEIRLPAFAIGGITLENLDDVLATGIRRVAVSAAILDAADPAAATRAMTGRLNP